MMGEKTGRAGEQSDYQSYLLRLWRVDETEERWQASLESTHTGERKGFASLDALFAYVRSQTRAGTRGGIGGDGLATR